MTYTSNTIRGMCIKVGEAFAGDFVESDESVEVSVVRSGFGKHCNNAINSEW